MKSAKLVLGTVQFGLSYGINNTAGKPTEAEIFSILNKAYDEGVRMLDTADAYGNSLQLIARFHRAHPDKKFDIISKTSAKNAHADLSLKLQLQLEELGIASFSHFMLHDFKDLQNSPLMEQLLEAKTRGYIRQLGASIYTNKEFAAAIASPVIQTIQLPFNLLDNSTLKGDLLRRANEAGKHIHARSVFLQGLFFMPGASVPAALQPILPYLQQIHIIAARLEVPVNCLALNYVLKNDLIHHVLFGVDTLQQLTDNLTYASTDLPDDAYAQIDQIAVEKVELLNPVNWK